MKSKEQLYLNHNHLSPSTELNARPSITVIAKKLCFVVDKLCYALLLREGQSVFSILFAVTGKKLCVKQMHAVVQLITPRLLLSSVAFRLSVARQHKIPLTSFRECVRACVLLSATSTITFSHIQYLCTDV